VAHSELLGIVISKRYLYLASLATLPERDVSPPDSLKLKTVHHRTSRWTGHARVAIWSGGDGPFHRRSLSGLLEAVKCCCIGGVAQRARGHLVSDSCGSRISYNYVEWHCEVSSAIAILARRAGAVPDALRHVVFTLPSFGPLVFQKRRSSRLLFRIVGILSKWGDPRTGQKSASSGATHGVKKLELHCMCIAGAAVAVCRSTRWRSQLVFSSVEVLGRSFAAKSTRH